MTLDEKSPNAPPTPGRLSRAARERPGGVGGLVQEVWPDTLFGGQIPVLGPKSDPRRKVPERPADPGLIAQCYNTSFVPFIDPIFFFLGGRNRS